MAKIITYQIPALVMNHEVVLEEERKTVKPSKTEYPDVDPSDQAALLKAISQITAFNKKQDTLMTSQPDGIYLLSRKLIL